MTEAKKEPKKPVCKECGVEVGPFDKEECDDHRTG